MVQQRDPVVCADCKTPTENYYKYVTRYKHDKTKYRCSQCHERFIRDSSHEEIFPYVPNSVVKVF